MKTIYFCHDQQQAVDERVSYLEAAGYQVLLTETGGDLMRAIAQEEPDLLLMDVLLPGKNGFEVLDGLGLTEHERFPVILFSGVYTRKVYESEALRIGASRYLPTTLERDELLAVVDELIDPGSESARAA